MRASPVYFFANRRTEFFYVPASRSFVLQGRRSAHSVYFPAHRRRRRSPAKRLPAKRPRFVGGVYFLLRKVECKHSSAAIASSSRRNASGQIGRRAVSRMLARSSLRLRLPAALVQDPLRV